MRSLEELIKTPRMHYLPMYDLNSVEGLYDLIQEIVKKHYIIVEVGSFAGVSSDLFARYCKKLFCVDIWTSKLISNGIGDEFMVKGFKMFEDVINSHKNIEAIEGLSVEVSKGFKDRSINMVYIDARHDYESVKSDIEAWLPKIKHRGWMTGHDMGYDGVQKAVEEVLGTNYNVYKDASWAVKIK